MIVDGGLTILATKRVIISEKILSVLYGHTSFKIQKRLREQLLGKNCPVMMVEGRNAVVRLFEIVGREAASAKNPPGTIRWKFGDHHPDKVHLNAAHRPRTDSEAKDHLILFGFLTDARLTTINLS